MALRLKNSVFIHVPKAGGTWVTGLLSTLGLGLVTEAIPVRVHGSLKKVYEVSPELISLKSFCFVRHPFTWYQSFWRYRVAHGWDAKNALDECRADSFEGFIANVVERRPGHLSARLRELTEGVTYVGKFEALRESLVLILSALGEKFDPAAVYDFPRENASPDDISARYSAELLQRLYETEADAFHSFGYDINGTEELRS